MTAQHDRIPEMEAPRDPFEWMIGVVRTKFLDALVAQTQNPSFTFVGVPFRHPRFEDAMALFSLADDTEDDMTARAKEIFMVGVPIAVPGSFEAPVTTLGSSPDRSSFLLVHIQNGQELETVVDRAGYPESTDVHLRDFEDKVMQYTPYPMQQHRDI